MVSVPIPLLPTGTCLPRPTWVGQCPVPGAYSPGGQRAAGPQAKLSLVPRGSTTGVCGGEAGGEGWGEGWGELCRESASVRSWPSVGRKQGSGALEAGPSAPAFWRPAMCSLRLREAFLWGREQHSQGKGGRCPPPTPTSFRAPIPNSLGKTLERTAGLSRGSSARTDGHVHPRSPSPAPS